MLLFVSFTTPANTHLASAAFNQALDLQWEQMSIVPALRDIDKYLLIMPSILCFAFVLVIDYLSTCCNFVYLFC